VSSSLTLSRAFVDRAGSIQVNHFSTMLLTVLLLPCLLKAASSGTSPNPRVVIVLSDVHYWAKLSKEEVESEKILQKLRDKNYCTPQWVHSFSRRRWQ
jgi:retinol dehydrogenase-12